MITTFVAVLRRRVLRPPLDTRRRRRFGARRRRLVTRATRRRVFFILRLRFGFAMVLLLGLLRCAMGFKCNTSGLGLRRARGLFLLTLAFVTRAVLLRLRFREAFKAAFCLAVPECLICLGDRSRRVLFLFLRGFASRVVWVTLIQSLISLVAGRGGQTERDANGSARSDDAGLGSYHGVRANCPRDVPGVEARVVAHGKGPHDNVGLVGC